MVDSERRPARRPPVPAIVRRVAALLAPLGVPVTEVVRYWLDERRALRTGMVALLLAATADLFAGLVLGEAGDRLEEVPGILVLIPAAIAMRGATFGALGARLGTAILTGQFDRELKPGTWLGDQVEATTILTLVTSLEAAVLAKLLSQALGLAPVPLWELVVVSVVGGLLASALLFVVTITLARQSQARGWNLDDVGAPAITASGDLLAIPALLVATVLVGDRTVSLAIGVALTLLTLAALAYGWVHRSDAVRRIVRESTLVLTGAATVSVLAGIVVESRQETFTAVPTLLVLFPPFIAMFGSLGGLLSSRLTSKLHLGLIEPRPLPQKAAALDFSMVFLFALAVFTFVGSTVWLAAGLTGLTPPPLPTMVGVSVFGGMLGTTLLAGVAYAASAATYRFGLDPDNHAIPIVTSVMDFLGMLCLVLALATFGVGAA